MLVEESVDVMLMGLCSIGEAFLLVRSFGELVDEGNFNISFILGSLLVKEEELQESGVIGVLLEFNNEEIGVVFWLLLRESSELSL